MTSLRDVASQEDCRYALYDVEFEVEGGGKRAKLMFIVWYVT